MCVNGVAENVSLPLLWKTIYEYTLERLRFHVQYLVAMEDSNKGLSNILTYVIGIK